MTTKRREGTVERCAEGAMEEREKRVKAGAAMMEKAIAEIPKVRAISEQIKALSSKYPSYPNAGHEAAEHDPQIRAKFRDLKIAIVSEWPETWWMFLDYLD